VGKTSPKLKGRIRRKRRIRRKISGTAAKPRLSVFRSSKHIYAQVVDDTANNGNGHTLVSVSDQSPSLSGELAGKKKSEKAFEVGKKLAALCREQGIETVVFDRNGFIFHGRIKAVADGARDGDNGLKF